MRHPQLQLDPQEPAKAHFDRGFKALRRQPGGSLVPPGQHVLRTPGPHGGCDPACAA